MHGDRLPAGNHWFGLERNVIARNTAVVDNDTAYKLARVRQADAQVANIDARIRLARKYAEVLDLQNLLAEDQRQREHARDLAETRRVGEKLAASQSMRMTVLQHELDSAKAREQIVRAERNLEAARRVADVQVDQWYQQAAASRNEATATRQDTDADLRRTQATASPDALKAAADDELARALATIDNEIELARQRGNAAAVLALQNIKARLKSAA
jgi:hypothetical protein